MNQIIKPAVKQDLDRYVDIVDTASEALEQLEQRAEIQEQVDEGYGDDDELALIDSNLQDIKERWIKQAEGCGHTNAKGSVDIPLSGTVNLDHKKLDDLSNEIRRAKLEVTGLEKMFGIKAKPYRNDG